MNKYINRGGIYIKRRKIALIAAVLILLASIVVFSTKDNWSIKNIGFVDENKYSGEKIFIGSTITWEGYLNPKIVDIEFCDGSRKYKSDENSPVKIFVEPTQHVGTCDVNQMNELKNSGTVKLEDFKGYRMSDRELPLVFEVLINEKENTFLKSGILLRYKVLGITKEKYVVLFPEK